MHKISKIILLMLVLILSGCNTDNDNKTNEEPMDNLNIIIEVENIVLTATLYDNPTSRDFLKKLPLTITMNDLNRNEKYYNFSEDLASSPTEKPAMMYKGDLMIWSGNTLVVFYETFSNSYGGYVQLGKITGNLDIFNNSNKVTVTIKLDETKLNNNHQHQISKINSKDATCQVEGNIEYFYCEICEKYFFNESGINEFNLEDTKIAALKHDVNFEVFKLQSYVEDGLIEVTCSNCDYIDDIVFLLNNAMEFEKKESTILEEGYIKYRYSFSYLDENYLINFDITIPLKEENDDMIVISIKIGNQTWSAKLYDNITTRALLEKLPLIIEMSDLNRLEKYYYLDSNLPFESTERPTTINQGEIMLWSSSCLVLFYETFSNSYGGYVRLGYIEGDLDLLVRTIGTGKVTLAWNIQ